MAYRPISRPRSIQHHSALQLSVVQILELHGFCRAGAGHGLLP